MDPIFDINKRSTKFRQAHFRANADILSGPSDKIWLGIVWGLIFWALVGGAVVGALAINISTTIIAVVFILISLVGLHFALRGCDFGPDSAIGSMGYIIKLFAIILIFLLGLLIALQVMNSEANIFLRILCGLIAAVDLILVIFWTGRGMLREYYG